MSIVECQGKLLQLNDTNKAELKNKYSEDEVVIIEVNYFIRYIYVQMKYFVLEKMFHLRENLFWFVETCVSYHQFAQNLYLLLMTLKQWKDL